MCTIEYDGQQDGIHFWTKATASVAELGYRFIKEMIDGGTTFSYFCDIMTYSYHSKNPNFHKFMSVSVFISWFLNFSSCFDIDFRLSIDPQCGHSPKYLACDATHVGIRLQNLDIADVTASELEEVVVPSHLKYDRVFLPYNRKPEREKKALRDARAKLLALCKFFQGYGGQLLSQDDLVEVNECLESEDPRCKLFLENFISDIFLVGLRQAAASFLALLLGSRPITSIFCYRKVADIQRIVLSLVNDFSHIEEISFLQMTPLLTILLKEANEANHLQCVIDFVLYLCECIQELHLQDMSLPHANPIPESYNPASGIAYYFTPHGNQLRNIPKFSLNRSATKPDDEDCRKKAVPSTKQDWSHLFLWFCPIHGHCYGYHIIKGAEGPKDAFASSAKYMEKPPEEIYYDNACHLNDYCFNRAPAYFRDSQFWFDIFHSTNHKCGDNHRCQDITGIFNGDTSICEQFNSHLRNFKYIATHLTQPKFCFLLQLIIHYWNEKKTASWQRNEKHRLENRAITSGIVE